MLALYGREKAEAARLLGAIAAKDPLRVLAMSYLVGESEYTDAARFTRQAGPFAAGIGAAVAAAKKVQTSAQPKKK